MHLEYVVSLYCYNLNQYSKSLILILASSCIICAALLLGSSTWSCWHPRFWLYPWWIIRRCHASCTITIVIGLHIKALWSIGLVETRGWHQSWGTIVQHMLALAHVDVLHHWRKTCLIHWVSLWYEWLCILVVAEHICGKRSRSCLIQITSILILSILIRWLLPLLWLIIWIVLLLGICWYRLIWRYKDVWWVLWYRSSTSDCFNLFDSEFLFRVSLILFTESLVFLINIHDQLLHVIACY